MKKKRMLLLVFVAILFTFACTPNVFAGDFTCSAFGDDVIIDTKIADIVSTIILAIQIAVPILLVVYGMLDLGKAIMAQKEDEIKKGQQTFIKRVIAAVLVFFVIVIVKMIINFVSKDNRGIMSCANCFIQGSNSDSCNRVDTGSGESGGSGTPSSTATTGGLTYTIPAGQDYREESGRILLPLDRDRSTVIRTVRGDTSGITMESRIRDLEVHGFTVVRTETKTYNGKTILELQYAYPDGDECIQLLYIFDSETLVDGLIVSGAQGTYPTNRVNTALQIMTSAKK